MCDGTESGTKVRSVPRRAAPRRAAPRRATPRHATPSTACKIMCIIIIIIIIIFIISSSGSSRSVFYRVQNFKRHATKLQAARATPRLVTSSASYNTANLPTNIVDFGGFDSSIILIQRGGIPRPLGDFPESSSQAMLVGIMLGGGLGVQCQSPYLCHTRPYHIKSSYDMA